MMKAPQFYIAPKTTGPVTQCHILEDFNQLQQRCETLKSYKLHHI